MERFKLLWWNVAERAVEALGIVEVLDPFGHGDRQLDLVRHFLRLSSSICMDPQKLSMGALS